MDYKENEFLKYIESEINKSNMQPIYEIYLMSKDGNDTLKGKDGKDLGWPDCGSTDTMGYYYTLEDAVHCMNSNSGDIRECLYDAGFILCRFPGIYNPVSKPDRLYYKWDILKDGFFRVDEPRTFTHIAL